MYLGSIGAWSADLNADVPVPCVASVWAVIISSDS